MYVHYSVISANMPSKSRTHGALVRKKTKNGSQMPENHNSVEIRRFELLTPCLQSNFGARFATPILHRIPVRYRLPM